MTNLSIIKPKPYEVQIDKKSYPLIYDLKAFAFIEEQFNSVDEAIELFNKKESRAIATMLQAGLLHTNVKNIQKILKGTSINELTLIIANALNDVLCADYSFDKEFDWQLLYFIAKPALGFSEEEFWSSTPKKILTMMKMLEELKKGGQTKDTLTGDDAVKAIMKW